MAADAGAPFAAGTAEVLAQVLTALRAFLAAQPGRERVYAVVDALGLAAGAIIAGTEALPEDLEDLRDRLEWRVGAAIEDPAGLVALLAPPANDA